MKAQTARLTSEEYAASPLKKIKIHLMRKAAVYQSIVRQFLLFQRLTINFRQRTFSTRADSFWSLGKSAL